MTDLPYRLMIVTRYTAHEVGFQSPEAIHDVLDLENQITAEQSEKILAASALGKPLFAGLDPYAEQINGCNIPVFSDTEEGVREQQIESGMNI